MAEAGLQVLARTTGPAASNIVTFSVAERPGTTYCAYALSDGAILVKQVSQPTHSQSLLSSNDNEGERPQAWRRLAWVAFTLPA